MTKSRNNRTCAGMPHIMELLGKTRVVVKDGKVVEVGIPQVEWCPLFSKLR